MLDTISDLLRDLMRTQQVRHDGGADVRILLPDGSELRPANLAVFQGDSTVYIIAAP